jgi:Flp pilus assembly protein TadG
MPADEAGTTTMEFALVGAMFLLMIFAILEVSLYFFTSQSLQTLTSLVARATQAGTVNPGCPATIPTSLASQVPMLSLQSANICVTQATVSGQIQVTVNSTYPFTFFSPLLPGDVGTLTASSQILY